MISKDRNATFIIRSVTWKESCFFSTKLAINIYCSDIRFLARAASFPERFFVLSIYVKLIVLKVIVREISSVN